jgi:hypothetical protein
MHDGIGSGGKCLTVMRDAIRVRDSNTVVFIRK